MPRKPETPWYVWAMLIAGAWLAMGQPLPLVDGGAPFPADGLKVVTVAQEGVLTSKQEAVLFSIPAAVKSAGGEYRKCSPTVAVTNDAQWVQDAMRVERGDGPWLILSDGNSGFNGPLPESIAEAASIIKKHGG